jgi:hypothetical protein
LITKLSSLTIRKERTASIMGTIAASAFYQCIKKIITI